jgi:hypothetical protein
MLGTVLPESAQRADCRRIIAFLQEAAESFALRAAVLRILGVVEFDLEFGDEEFREAGIGKIQDEAASPDEIDEVVYEAQID